MLRPGLWQFWRHIAPQTLGMIGYIYRCGALLYGLVAIRQHTQLSERSWPHPRPRTAVFASPCMHLELSTGVHVTAGLALVSLHDAMCSPWSAIVWAHTTYTFGTCSCVTPALVAALFLFGNKILRTLFN